MNITELYNKRASAWEEAKKFLDTHTQENGTMTAEDAATYEKMEADISNLSKQIERQQRLDEMENIMRQPASTPITNMPAGLSCGTPCRSAPTPRAASWCPMSTSAL